MNKIAIRYILFIVAGFVILLLLFRDRSSFGKRNTSFAVKEGTVITRVDLYQGDKKISLQRNGEKWFLNKTIDTRKSAVLFLIRTLNELKIKSPVSSEIFRSEIEDKKIIPVRVNVYARRKLVKSFYVYKTGSNIYGNIMKLRVSSKPFIVAIPGFEDNIGSHFSMNELFWQPYTVFNSLPSRIASVELINLKEADNSFTLKNMNGTISVSGNSGNLARWDSLRTRRYISYFTFVSFETWAFELTDDEKKEISSSSPLYKITVKAQDGSDKTLTIWEKWKTQNGSRITDTDRVWGKCSDLGDDIFVMRYFDIDPILKKKSYFFKD
jgi:hypothetical protein